MDSSSSFNIEDFENSILFKFTGLEPSNGEKELMLDGKEHKGHSDLNSATLNSINTLIGGGMLGKPLIFISLTGM